MLTLKSRARDNLGLLHSLLCRIRSRRSSALWDLGTQRGSLATSPFGVLQLFGLMLRTRWGVNFLAAITRVLALIFTVFSIAVVAAVTVAVNPFLVLFSVGHRVQFGENLQDTSCACESDSRTTTRQTEKNIKHSDMWA